MHSTSKSSKGLHTPPHWPSHIRYISKQLYHSSVLPDIRRQICPQSSAMSEDGGCSSRSLVAIRLISDPTHPANGQYGLFAAKKIPPRTHILDYAGEVHCDDRPESDYDLSLYRTQNGISVGVDARAMGNEARFVNDYRGIKPKPNAAFEERTMAGELRMSVVSGSEFIKKGDEILVSYGKSWWRARSEGTSATG
ncbi:SET domain protein [Wolfiporia cocos MD-104 SS10]|uniref:SET domain protein n=1 Tax=Wolfiporia cocos (strain MD-104) TaxID=742152 RepID=A0A2H3ITR2_WOLCO|nr:SET domain protein [Wolfiporia cocos MD-104 SS10]